MASSSLLASVQSAFSTAVALGYNSGTAAHDVYEGYVLAKLVEAARSDGWTCELRDSTGALTTRAVFRLGPGRLPSGNFSHVRLSKPGKPDLEAHIGVKVRGKSPVAHEFDLLVLRRSAADLCRRTGSDPVRSDVVIHAEAKYYGGNLSLPIGRAVVGLAVDCDMATIHPFVSPSVLVTNQNGFTVEQLIAHYGVTFRFLITPANPRGEYFLEDLFRELLKTA